MRLDTWRLVEAPEGVELGLRVAGPFPRAIAWGIDLAIRLGIYMGLGTVLMLLGEIGMGILLVFIFVLDWGWSIVFEVYRHGATPGKKMIGIHVVQDDGAPVGWTQSALRNLLRPADMLPFGYVFGLISCYADADFKRLGDRVAGTVVVYTETERRLPKLAKAEPLAPPVPLSLDEQSALVEFALRAPHWPRPRQVEVADQVTELTGQTGTEGVRRLYGMARWIQGGS